ncbi:MAG: ATP-grasp domain-containing protein [Chitinophagales bacterium]
MQLTFLCITSFFKGEDFIIACQQTGCKVFLLTSVKLKDKPWPNDHITETFYMQQDETDNWNMEEAIVGLAHFMQNNKVDRIVALDDFDVEKAALLREHFRSPGMGQTTARHFRDKLAMRLKAAESSIRVPAFSSLFHNETVHDYTQHVAAPWLVKPRSEASATGITKLHNAHDLWQHLNNDLGTERHNYLIEQFRPGDVYHVDALSLNGTVIFVRSSRYLSTPFEVAHGGGIFRTRTLDPNSEDAKALAVMNQDVLQAFGLQYGASHTEFIKDRETGEFVFLETASRVGGAHIAEMVTFSSGINLWAEWAKIEVAVVRGENYQLPEPQDYHGGLVVSLSRYKHPSYDAFTDAEICWTLQKEYHIGLIIRSENPERVGELLNNYLHEIHQNYHTSV